MSADGKTLVGLPMDQYLRLPAVSASMIGDILDRCPKAAFWNSWLNPNRVRDTSPAMDAGTIAHSILLEGNADCCVVIDPSEHPNEKGGGVATGWTNKSVRAARDLARDSGKIPILKDDIQEISAMVAAAMEFIESLKDTEPAIWQAFQPDGGESEVTFTWQDGPTPCRIRPDRISKDRRLIIDAKFTATSAEPDAWGRSQMIRMGYYVSAAFYRRGIQAVCDVEPQYVFLVVETEPPYLCSLVGMDPHAFELGAQKVSLGLQEWAACVKSGVWPGYPRVTLYPEIPAWVDAAWEQRQMEDPFMGKA